MHTMQALEKTSRAPCTLSALIPSMSAHGSILTGKTSQRAGKRTREGEKTCTTPPTKPQALHFLTHHPTARLQGHASRLCMTARNVPCHKCFPKASTSMTLSAFEASPQPSCTTFFFFWMCQAFLAGWPDTAPWRCLLCLLYVSVYECWDELAYVCLNIFMSFSVFLRIA